MPIPHPTLLDPMIEPLIQPPSPDNFAASDLECAPLKQSLERFQQWMSAAFQAGESAESLIAART
ncbi:hypothetical protein BXG10_25340, partial [Salmonella enterica subsp. enterica serovar Enteritidis]|nr:hypothetical protein [Salmonella enterica subsp. enterica serovar Enteritidis]